MTFSVLLPQLTNKLVPIMWAMSASVTPSVYAYGRLLSLPMWLHMPARPEALSGKRRPSMFTRSMSIQGVELQRNLRDIAPSWHFLISNSSNNTRCLEVVEAFLDAHEETAQVDLLSM